ncbi:MAG: anthranilate phosphoribosyltransferase [Candidatus Melainabacteria bacterium]|nr:anthranilate phosphoribosyltransferase [Candidatus Melainabacteria bacterium]
MNPDLAPNEVDLVSLLDQALSESEALSVLERLSTSRIDFETLSLLHRLISERLSPDFPKNVQSEQWIDCCGTGGSGLPQHFNTSTMSAFILAAGGLKVGKFGNRAASSRSGSFDFLGSVGIFPEKVSLSHFDSILKQSPVCFLFAPQCYPSLSALAPLRKKLGTRTLFNDLGPLLNPLRPSHRLLGVSSETMQPLLAQWLSQNDNTQEALVVRAYSGLDELSPTEINTLLWVRGSSIESSTYQGNLASLSNEPVQQPLSPEDNAALFFRLINGSDTASSYYEMLTLNAGAGLWVGQKANSLEEGQQLAKALLGNGAVKAVYEACREVYHRVSTQ